MQRNGLPVLCRIDRSFCGLHDAGALQCGDRTDLASKLLFKVLFIDLIAVLLDQVHHVQRDHDRDAELGELRGQVQIAFKVRSVDDVEDRVRLFTDQVISCDHFLQSIGGKGINAGKVGNDHVIMLLQLAFLLFDRNTRPVSYKLVGSGQTVEQSGLTAVWVARKGDSDAHI